MPKLRHMGIITLAPDEPAKFYADVFGMETIRRSRGGGGLL